MFPMRLYTCTQYYLQETKLKTAILDYLKRYHPGDTDTYTMVALKFMMYREIAQLLEQKANKRLDMFKSRPIGMDKSSIFIALMGNCVF